MTTQLRLGFDIGGTFTDFVLTDPATGTLRLSPRACSSCSPSPAWRCWSGLRVGWCMGDCGVTAAKGEMEMFAGGVIAGDALTGFYKGIAANLRR